MEIVGKSLPRKDALDKVTGRARFIDDYTRKDLLHASTVRSPKPHIRIISVDKKEALSLPGVFGVYTHKDIPGDNRVPFVFQDYPFLAEKDALFAGQHIALVAADSRERAQEAASKVKIKYEELPALFDPLEALKPESRKIYGKDNIFRSYRIRKGNINKGFDEADVIVGRTYTTNYQVHGYLEPQGMLAEPGNEGSVVVYGSMQCPFYVLDAVAAVLGIPQSRVRIVQATTGGAFGGKEDVPSI
ncbi:MAG TPA: molybdopterin cofactor-binding domain-containing protein, partial [bacterium]|nr:molybdopterin cofactor-binding domain-containing protein [bacterium]